jgi:hypothetical protein
MAKSERKREPGAIKRGKTQRSGFVEANEPAPEAPGLIDPRGERTQGVAPIRDTPKVPKAKPRKGR